MAEAGLSFDVAHTSLLTRAVMTCHLALNGMGQVWLPVQRHWKWNERHYGALQGLDKKATTEQHGEAQTKVWRRSFDVPPPPVDSSSPEHPATDSRYRFIDPALLPATECLKDVVERVVPHFHETVVPQLRAGMNVLIAAHGNSLRALVMALEGISEADIAELNIPTGVPRLYALCRLKVSRISVTKKRFVLLSKVLRTKQSRISHSDKYALQIGVHLCTWQAQKPQSITFATLHCSQNALQKNSVS
jgi:2,3-bisphosphoglycerate-dependent phosphoglycerate mutase